MSKVLIKLIQSKIWKCICHYLKSQKCGNIALDKRSKEWLTILRVILLIEN